MTNLNSIRRKADYLSDDAQPWERVIWPRIEAFNHFIKSNKAKLQAAGAIQMIGREWFIVADVFPTVAAELLGVALTESEGGEQ